MMDFNKFMKDGMKDVLAKLPPKERADMNRMTQNLGKIMTKATTSNKDFTDEILTEHEDFKKRLAKHQEEHNKTQSKYADNSNK